MTGLELCVIIKASLAWLSPYQEGVACKHAAYIIQQAEKRDIDPLLVTAIIYRESAFRPRVVSRAGACGLMQVIPKYSRYTCEELKQPRVAIREGTRALVTWLSWAKGSLAREKKSNKKNPSPIEIALCGYNAGTRCITNKNGKFARRVRRTYVRKVLETLDTLNGVPGDEVDCAPK